MLYDDDDDNDADADADADADDTASTIGMKPLFCNCEPVPFAR